MGQLSPFVGVRQRSLQCKSPDTRSTDVQKGYLSQSCMVGVYLKSVQWNHMVGGGISQCRHETAACQRAKKEPTICLT